MGHPRIVARGATYAATRRCVLRKNFLGWWDPEVDRIWLWCLAVATAKCGVELHHAVRVGSHYHITFTVTRNNLGEFLWWLNLPMSRALNALLTKRGFDAPSQLFDSRQMHVMRLLDADAQMISVLYERLNVVAAGLAETCDGVPGVTLGPRRWKSRRGLRVRKPSLYFDGDIEERSLVLAPPPLVYLAFGGDMDAIVHHFGVLEREGERRIRQARAGRPARTPAEVRAIHPWDEPKTLKEAGGGRVPCFKTGLGSLARIAAAKEVRKWRGAYGEAEGEWRAGDQEVEFPHGTHLLATRYGANVAEPGAEAWVSAPGPTLADARARVAAGAVDRDAGLVDRVRASMVVDDDDGGDGDHGDSDDDGDDDGGDDSGGGGRPRPPYPDPPPGDTPQRPDSEHLHRFDERPPGDRDDAPRRLVFRRDARPGRRSGDPPHQ